MSDFLRILCVGDVIGLPGMAMFQKWIPKLKEKYSINAIIVNGENAAKNGMGLTPRIIDFFKKNDASVITTGNHVFDQTEVYTALNERNDVVRPANYPPGCPGKGLVFFTIFNHSVAVINLHGRVFVKELLDCPFRTVDSLLMFVRTKTNIIFVDFHAEATSEKRAIGGFLDGKISGIFGTHTHVQTADEQILPHGTAYITDAGACGALNSVVGMEQDAIIKRFMVHHRMGKFVVEDRGPLVLCGVLIDVNPITGKAIAIQRIRIVDDEINIDGVQERKIDF